MQKRTSRADDSTIRTIQQYSPMVYRLAYSLVKSKCDAEDIHQEVFVRYITKAPAFESGEHEKAWFIRVTTNLCKNWWRTAWKRKVVSLTEYEEEYGDIDKAAESRYGAETLEAQLQEDKAEDIIRLVKTLPQKYRVVIHLFYYEELSVEEIAGALQLKPSTVRTQLTRARCRLGELLKKENPQLANGLAFSFGKQGGSDVSGRV